MPSPGPPRTPLHGDVLKRGAENGGQGKQRCGPTKSGWSAATSKGAAPAHWVASITSAAPTSLHRAATVSSGIVVPSNQNVGVIATTAVSGSILSRTASPQLPPQPPAAASADGGGTTRIAAPASVASCCQTNRFDVCSPPSETRFTADDSLAARFRAATAIPSARVAQGRGDAAKVARVSDDDQSAAHGEGKPASEPAAMAPLTTTGHTPKNKRT